MEHSLYEIRWDDIRKAPSLPSGGHAASTALSAAADSIEERGRPSELSDRPGDLHSVIPINRRESIQSNGVQK